MKILNTTSSLHAIKMAINHQDRCIFTRFGDLDILFASGEHYQPGRPLPTTPMGGNRSVWNKEIQMELQECVAIDDPCFLLGMSGDYADEPGMVDGVFKSFPTRDTLVRKIKEMTDRTEFLIPVLFQYICLFQPDTFKDFVNNYIRGKKILFIGGVPKADAEVFVGNIDYYVPTPSTDAYSEIDIWWPIVNAMLDDNEIDIVLPACGQSGRVISKRIYDRGDNVVSIDMGSLWDAISRPTTRTWLREKHHIIAENFLGQPA